MFFKTEQLSKQNVLEAEIAIVFTTEQLTVVCGTESSFKVMTLKMQLVLIAYDVKSGYCVLENSDNR